MSHGARKAGGIALSFLAICIVLTEVGLHLYAALAQRQYEASKMMLFIALIMGFVGLYILDPRRAKDGGRFLVDNTIRVLQVLRLGRRKEDPLAVTVQDTEGNTTEIAVPSLPTDDDKNYEEHVGRRHTDLELPPPESPHGKGDG